jgi:fumarylacetoacetate (FAA) hydrolase
MKLGSIKGPGRDGTLVVVSRDLSQMTAVPDVAPTLQSAIERWAEVESDLASVYGDLQAGRRKGALKFDCLQMASPLPRAYQFLDGSVYLHHMEKARKARGAEMPMNYKTEPLMYQGLSDRFDGPKDPMRVPSEDLELDYEAEIAIITDDVPMGVRAAAAASHIKLVMLLNDYTLRSLTRTELPKGFGFMQAKPTSSFSPVALTLDELGSRWREGKLHIKVRSGVNHQQLGEPDAGKDMFFSYTDLIVHAARTRTLAAGTIIGAGSISNQDEGAGHGCIAELRIHEQMKHGAARTPWLQFDDIVRIEALDDSGASIFGTIEQRIEKTAY